MAGKSNFAQITQSREAIHYATLRVPVSTVRTHDLKMLPRDDTQSWMEFEYFNCTVFPVKPITLVNSSRVADHFKDLKFHVNLICIVIVFIL